jgi:hypothetical protein
MRLSFALSAMLFAVGLSAAQAASAADEDKPSQPQRPAQAARPRASDTLKPPKKHASSSPITDRFALRVLYWPTSITTDLRLDQRDGTTGTELSAENDLGMKDSKSQGRAELTFRLRERNRLRVDYMKLSRNGDRVLNKQINFGNQTFNVTDRAQTLLEWRSLTVRCSTPIASRPASGSGSRSSRRRPTARCRLATSASIRRRLAHSRRSRSTRPGASQSVGR